MMDNKHNPFDSQQHPSQTASRTPVNKPENKKPSPASPKGRHTQRESGSKGSLYLSNLVEQQTHLLVHLLGYGLLVFALLDYIYILIPLRFTNPNWEFQTIGALVEHAAIPLLGLMLVFYRHQGYILKREKNLLWFLSWVSLVVGLLYLLMLPLGIIDTGRIYHANNAQITAQVSQQRQRIQQIKGKLNQAKTDKQLNQIFAALTRQGRSPQVKNPQAFKDQALDQISQTERNLQAQTDLARANQLKALGKQSLKWNLGALVSGVLFIWVWHLTRWARVKELPTK
jgi:hypothetical protein